MQISLSVWVTSSIKTGSGNVVFFPGIFSGFFICAFDRNPIRTNTDKLKFLIRIINCY
ncbi:MAG: hypothetical protein IPM51_04900 [Sphingobacteriaceae bacterium]|nr:hypothetical protein [Sphingobacteriaceae bacterium]